MSREGSFQLHGEARRQDILKYLLTPRKPQINRSYRKQQQSTKRLSSPNKTYNNKSFHTQASQGQTSQASQREQQFSHTPKINKKSCEMAEESFRKLKEQKTTNFFSHKSQQTQTKESIKEKKLTPSDHKIIPLKLKKQKKIQDEEDEDQPHTPKKISVSIQTDRQKPTPLKLQKLEPAYSGKKQSYYIPIHDRSDYEVQAKSDRIKHLQEQQVQSERSQRLKTQPQDDDLRDEEERLEDFIERSNKWVKKKQNKLKAEQMKNAEQQQIKQKNNESQSRKPINKELRGLDFNSRQKYYETKKAQIIKQLREDDTEKCTFTPRISHVSKNIIHQQMKRDEEYYYSHQQY